MAKFIDKQLANELKSKQLACDDRSAHWVDKFGSGKSKQNCF